jgi:hypothetical protein
MRQQEADDLRMIRVSSTKKTFLPVAMRKSGEKFVFYTDKYFIFWFPVQSNFFETGNNAGKAA